jgi:uncharacterized protein (DUF433 family)
MKQTEDAMLNTPSITQLINRDPEIMSGTPVFMGTRVPVKSLFDWLEGGETLDYFLENFPSVSREQAIAVLELYKDLLLAKVK